jgi:hypothetical protein
MQQWHFVTLQCYYCRLLQWWLPLSLPRCCRLLQWWLPLSLPQQLLSSQWLSWHLQLVLLLDTQCK